MSIFSTIASKIFGSAKAATPQDGGAPAAGSAPAASAPSGGSVDVEAILTAKQKEAGQDLNWRSSIVDLLKLLGLDSSLEARKQLADELHYTGDKNDSATMNVWLIKAVMTELAKNGGTVPDSLKH